MRLPLSKYWHSTLADAVPVYHNHPQCSVLAQIPEEAIQPGDNGWPHCSECAGLIERRVGTRPQIRRSRDR